MGNLHSIKKALENSGVSVKVVTRMKELCDAECIVFPGVGAFDKTVESMKDCKEDIKGRLDSGVPALGICIGMHILFEGSAEGNAKGIGFMKGRVERLESERIPHMGWNSVDSDDDIFNGIDDKNFYFAHSYSGCPKEPITIGTTSYDTSIQSLFKKKNTYGCQFHPEKSSVSGTAFLNNFIEFAEEQR